jgi:hypothetical protein
MTGSSRHNSRSLWGAACFWVVVACGRSEPTVYSTGNVLVTVITTGSNLDLDGYTVALDGRVSRPLAANGATVTFSQVDAGTHTVALSGLASNCAMHSPREQAVSVTGGAAAQVPFRVTCSPPRQVAFMSDRDGTFEII